MAAAVAVEDTAAVAAGDPAGSLTTNGSDSRTARKEEADG